MEKEGVGNEGFEESNESISPRVHSLTSNKNQTSVNQLEDGKAKLGTWGRGSEFLMSCIALSVGLGNIWRFPFTAYENGGGAFLLPYIIVLFLIGKPFYFFEMILGQFVSKGCIKSGALMPVMKGITMGQQVITICAVSYYCSIVALAIFFFVKSFYRTLPWSYCWDEWKDVHCVPSDPKLNATENFKNLTSQSSSELYFVREVIKQKDQIDDGIGLPDLELSLYLLLFFVILYIIIFKGVKSSGKVSYFLALFPYVVLITLLIRALTLEGSWEGIKFFITPDFSKLLKPQVWFAATTQLFFSLSVGWGLINTYSSFNRFDHNIYRDALIVTSMDTFTSLLGGFVVFGVLGNLAHNIGEKDVSKVISTGGTALAFISYPDAISKFNKVPQLFSILFFFMLVTLGTGSLLGAAISLSANARDYFPNLKKWILTLIPCVFGFFTGLIYVTPGGQWILNLVDYFGVAFLTLTFATLQLILVVWVYGLEDFCCDVEFMLKWKVTKFWRFSWGFVTPVLLLIIFIYSAIKFENPTFAGNSYPIEALVAGWLIFAVGISQILLWSFFMILRGKSVKEIFELDPAWGPKSKKTFEDWKEFKREKEERRKILSQDHSKMKKIYWSLMGKF